MRVFDSRCKFTLWLDDKWCFVEELSKFEQNNSYWPQYVNKWVPTFWQICTTLPKGYSHLAQLRDFQFTICFLCVSAVQNSVLSFISMPLNEHNMRIFIFIAYSLQKIEALWVERFTCCATNGVSHSCHVSVFCQSTTKTHQQSHNRIVSSEKLFLQWNSSVFSECLQRIKKKIAASWYNCCLELKWYVCNQQWAMNNFSTTNHKDEHWKSMQ